MNGIPKKIPKLGDYGFAKILDPNEVSAIKPHTNIGTAIFKAPELLKGESFNYRTDIYAIGVLAYYMLFGCLPFDPKNNNKDDLIKNQDIGELRFDPA